MNAVKELSPTEATRIEDGFAQYSQEAYRLIQQLKASLRTAESARDAHYSLLQAAKEERKNLARRFINRGYQVERLVKENERFEERIDHFEMTNETLTEEVEGCRKTIARLMDEKSEMIDKLNTLQRWVGVLEAREANDTLCPESITSEQLEELAKVRRNAWAEANGIEPDWHSLASLDKEDQLVATRALLEKLNVIITEKPESIGYKAVLDLTAEELDEGYDEFFDRQETDYEEDVIDVHAWLQSKLRIEPIPAPDYDPNDVSFSNSATVPTGFRFTVSRIEAAKKFDELTGLGNAPLIKDIEDLLAWLSTKIEVTETQELQAKFCGDEKELQEWLSANLMQLSYSEFPFALLDHINKHLIVEPVPAP